MLGELVNKTNIDSLVPDDAMDIRYHEISEENVWRMTESMLNYFGCFFKIVPKIWI